MPRAYWKGHLRLSLVTCPIELFPATSQSEKTHFHQINTKTGHRLRQQMVDEESGRVVDTKHKGRGYELSKGRYVAIDEDDLRRSRSRARTRSTSKGSCRRPKSTSVISTGPTTSHQAARSVKEASGARAGFSGSLKSAAQRTGNRDQDASSDKTGNQIADPTAERDAEEAQEPTGDRGSDDAEHMFITKPISLFMNCSASQPAIPPIGRLRQSMAEGHGRRQR